MDLSPAVGPGSPVIGSGPRRAEQVTKLIALDPKRKRPEQAISGGSPWNESEIPTRKGKINVLVVAPLGHPSNDERTDEIARKLADALDCYAIVNKAYQKPPFKKDNKGKFLKDSNGNKIRHDPDKSNPRKTPA